MLGVKAVPCPGGICTYAEELGSRLVSRGHEVTVYCRRQYVDEEDKLLEFLVLVSYQHNF